MYKKITIVDENDTVVGAADYFEAYEQKLIKRGARVFVFDTDEKQLLQKRGKVVRHPLLFDQAVGGHVDEGETYLEAALREMQEEIGLSGYELTEIATSYRLGDGFNGIFKLIVPAGTYIAYDTNEIDSIIWLTEAELEERIQNEPESFSAEYVAVWNEFRDALLS